MTSRLHEDPLIDLVADDAPAGAAPTTGDGAGPVDGWDAVCGDSIPGAVREAARALSPDRLVAWRRAFALGIPTVDAQHRGFIEMLNDLHDAVGRPDATHTVRALQQRLRSYAASHFADEEEFLRAVEYPEAEEQRLQHARFLRHLDSFDVERPDASAVLSFMTAWALEHVLGSDRGYLDWLNGERAAVGSRA